MNLIFILVIVIFANISFAKRHNPGDFLICSKFNCPINRGVCTTDNKCSCMEDYITIHDIKLGDYLCNYVKKSQAKAFLLEFVLGFGVGHFYMGNYVIAIVKLTISFIVTLVMCLLPHFKFILKSNEMKRVFTFSQTFFSLIYCCWQIIDGILIGLNQYKDGYGIAMKEW